MIHCRLSPKPDKTKNFTAGYEITIREIQLDVGRRETGRYYFS